MKIAFVHEWLITYAGAEKVLEAMLQEFPEAELYCLVDFLGPEERAKLGGRRPPTTFMQKIPFVRKIYRYLLLMMPIAIEQHDLSKFDIVISNCHSIGKGVITGPDQLHICYCYSPMRYAWDLQNQYLKESGFSRGLTGMMARLVFHLMRVWDVRTASGVDHFIACSNYIARRVDKAYRRSSTVIYPNVDVDGFVPGNERGDFYLTSSRMVPYKKMHLVVEAFTKMPDKRLVVIGDGPQFKRIKAMATPNIEILGYQPFQVLRDHMQRAKAFIFAAEEDFGITPLEAQACGTPVLAFGRGGAYETVVHGVTGLHFDEQNAEAIVDVVGQFEAMPADTFDPARIRAHAQLFSTQNFRRNFRAFIEKAWAAHKLRLTGPMAAPLVPPLASGQDNERGAPLSMPRRSYLRD
ncbi:glycosyl transferase [Azorhizobium oxalatiphilum]|uniref:Glycosyl transferase n=1 Tax=Azorhizobium oxalatiphilum TaxID=980631 RepID=A0A917BS10_9HYPH|nr:glycosyltransferase family 4 protein [Azorhizobium oxalatiphilum]GGF54256.1 glycosyl transferase [Azorhizobium oxalatiphilum]